MLLPQVDNAVLWHLLRVLVQTLKAQNSLDYDAFNARVQTIVKLSSGEDDAQANQFLEFLWETV